MHPLQSCFVSFYEQAKHVIYTCGKIVVAVGGSLGADFNLVFDLSSIADPQSHEISLKQALRHVSQANKIDFLYVTPADRKEKIQSILADNHFQKVGQATCVSFDHASLKKDTKKQDAYVAKRVQDAEAFKKGCAMIDEAFRLPKGDALKVYGPAINYVLSSETRHPLYILYEAQTQEPVSIAMLYLPEDKDEPAGHFCWGTRAHYRKKGAMSFLIQKMLHVAADKGYKRSVAQCYETSLRLAQRLGFQTQGILDVYANSGRGT